MAHPFYSRGQELLYHAEPTIIPHDLFCASGRIQVTTAGGRLRTLSRRFVRKRSSIEIGECLVLTDGSCYNNGPDGAEGECVVAFETERGAPKYIPEDKSFMDQDISRRLVYDLPKYTADNRYISPTSNRAKLFSAILALEARPWAEECWKTVVIAGDLEYVVWGITDWVWRWQENGWQRSNGRRVANIDLWEQLLDRIENVEYQGVSVKFWKVPRVKSN